MQGWHDGAHAFSFVRQCSGLAVYPLGGNLVSRKVEPPNAKPVTKHFEDEQITYVRGTMKEIEAHQVLLESQG